MKEHTFLATNAYANIIINLFTTVNNIKDLITM